MKAKFFDIDNVMIALKSIGSGIVAGLVTLPISGLMWFVRPTMPAVSWILGLVWLIAYALAYGFFSKKFWKWN